MNQVRLDTIEQVRKFLTGTTDVAFSTTEDQAARHRFVATVLKAAAILTDWRMGVARTLLRQGVSMKRVAPEVGYATTNALARAFAQRTGLSPTQWLSAQ